MNTITSERSFYIMDYSSHYYKVNSRDQLVAAGSENEATVFSFAEANRRIGAGKKSSFYFMTPVDENDEMISDPSSNADDELIDAAEPVTSTVRELKEAEIAKSSEKTAENYDLSGVVWEEYISEFSRIISKIDRYKDELGTKMAETDKKICDVLHYIELCDTDESEAQDLVELIRVCRENRRKYKDEIYCVEMFKKNLGTDGIKAKAVETIKAIRGMKKRKYTAREFAELFDGGVITAKNCREKSRCEIKEESIIRADIADCVKEEKHMEYIKMATPFDGQENDWLSFARKQAEFYENADQYITNLEIEIDEIDEAIAELMNVIEHANCNAAQGYKMFVRLKELSQARTKKDTELRVLYTLTGRFDMPSMMEATRLNAEAIDELINGPIVDMEDDVLEEKDEADDMTEVQPVIDIAEWTQTQCAAGR